LGRRLFVFGALPRVMVDEEDAAVTAGGVQALCSLVGLLAHRPSHVEEASTRDFHRQAKMETNV